MRVPPLKSKILLESNPLKSRIFLLVRRLAVNEGVGERQLQQGAGAGASPSAPWPSTEMAASSCGSALWPTCSRRWATWSTSTSPRPWRRWRSYVRVQYMCIYIYIEREREMFTHINRYNYIMDMSIYVCVFIGGLHRNAGADLRIQAATTNRITINIQNTLAPI